MLGRHADLRRCRTSPGEPDRQQGGAPPNAVYPGCLNINPTDDIVDQPDQSGRAAHLQGRVLQHAQLQARDRQRETVAGTTSVTISFANDTANPLDTPFGFANAAIGIFTSFNQVSKYVEGRYVYNNSEAYIQDNWKVNDRLTLDYGMRFVHQRRCTTSCCKAANFLPDKWSRSAAPAVYVFGCTGASPCSGEPTGDESADGAFLGPNTTAAVGTLVPGSGKAQRPLSPGQGIAKTGYTFPKLVAGPRFGMAYDLNGKQKVVMRGAIGTYFDRARPGNAHALIRNRSDLVTVRYSQLQNLTGAGLTTKGVPTIAPFEDNAKLPTATEWNSGVQVMLPWATAVDVAYTGRHDYNAEQTLNLNTVDIGTAHVPSLQDTTSAPSSTPGASSLAAQNPNQVRGYRGYGTITYREYSGWRDFHSIEVSVNRRFRNGLQFGFNDAIVLHDVAVVPPRYDHGADGQVVVRADQAQAQDLLGAQNTETHNLKGTFVWALPKLPPTENLALKTVGLIRGRLAALGHLVRPVGKRVHRGAAVSDRQREREPDRLSGLSARVSWLSAILARGAAATSTVSSTRRRSRDHLSGERGPGVREQLPPRLLLQRARPVHRPEYPSGRTADAAAAGRHVQRAECGRHHRPEHDRFN